jgi:hypothetical protein
VVDSKSGRPKMYVFEEDTRISVFDLDRSWIKITSGFFQNFVESESYTGGNMASLPIYVENLERGIYVRDSESGLKE